MLKNVTQMRVMLAAPFLLGVLFVFGTPLLSAPDELYHWQRAVQISEGHLFARRITNGEWGGKIDRGAFEYQIWFLKKFIDPKPIFVKDAWQEAKDLKPLSKERIEKPFPSTASFSPVAYIPQAAQGCPGNDSLCRGCTPSYAKSFWLFSGCRDSENGA